MKIHFAYMTLIAAASVGSYVVGQYVGLFKMQAHAFVLQESALQSRRYNFTSVQERLEPCERSMQVTHRSVLRDYEWYQSHWSSKFPDVSNIDERTESIYRLIEQK